MTNESKYPSDHLVTKWNALLDGELPPSEAATLMAEIESQPESKRFFDSQVRFNAVLASALRGSESLAMPVQLRGAISSQIKDAGRESEISASATSSRPNLRVLPSDDSRPISLLQRRLKLGWAVAGMAAMLFLGVVLGGLLPGDQGKGGPNSNVVIANQDTQNSANVDSSGLVSSASKANSISDPSSNFRILDVVGGRGTQLAYNLGTRDKSDLTNYAQSVGCPEIMKYVERGECGGGFAPVSIDQGDFGDGLKYRSVTFCAGFKDAVESGDPEKTGKCPTKGVMNRVVLFIIDGDIRPAGKSLDDKGCWMSCGNREAFAARWDPESKRTYLVFVPGAVKEQQVREVSEAVLQLSASDVPGR